MFGGLVLWLCRGRMAFAPAWQNPLSAVAIILGVGNILIASAVHKLLYRTGGPPLTPRAATARYQVLIIMRSALIEGGALFAAVATLITYNLVPLAMVAVCTAVLIVYRPTAQEFIRLTRHVGDAGPAT